MKNSIFSFKLLACAFVMLFAYNCEENEFEDISVAEGISFDASKELVVLESNEDTYDLVIQSTTVSSSDRVFEFEVIEENDNGDLTTANPDSYSVNNQVTIPAGELIGSTSVSFTVDDLNYSDPQNVVFKLIPGDYTLNNTRETFVLSFERACPLNLVSLNITTDDYPEETTWEIYDINVSTTEPIYSGGPLVDMVSTTVNIPVCLDSGSYGVIINDEYGDGIVGGSYSVTLNGNILTSGIVTGSMASSTFTID